jgi:phenylacetate-CoA ligase
LASHHAGGEPCACGRFETSLEGGILGRADDMVVVRGVNVYPTAVEQIVRAFPEIAEYQVHITKRGVMSEMRVVIEVTPGVKDEAAVAGAVETALQASLNLRVPVTSSAGGALPRAELKARRWLKH